MHAPPTGCAKVSMEGVCGSLLTRWYATNFLLKGFQGKCSQLSNAIICLIVFMDFLRFYLV